MDEWKTIKYIAFDNNGLIELDDAVLIRTAISNQVEGVESFSMHDTRTTTLEMEAILDGLMANPKTLSKLEYLNLGNVNLEGRAEPLEKLGKLVERCTVLETLSFAWTGTTARTYEAETKMGHCVVKSPSIRTVGGSSKRTLHPADEGRRIAKCFLSGILPNGLSVDMLRQIQEI